MNSDTVDYEDSCLIVRYLASMRPFAQSFDIYLTQVRLMLQNTFFLFLYEAQLSDKIKQHIITGNVMGHQSFLIWFLKKKMYMLF